MKKFITVIAFSIITLTFLNCRSTYITKNSDRWKKFELRPSQISLSGDTFFTSRLDDNTYFGVFYDKVVSQDGGFYYTTLMDDFGWYRNSTGNWSGDPYTVRRHKDGHIYVNPKRKVAMYFYSSTNDYRAFKVKIESKK